MIQVDYLVVADAAYAADGKHFLHGAGFGIIYAGSLPVTHPMLAVAVRLRVPWLDANTPYDMDLDVVDADEETLLPQKNSGRLVVGRPPMATPGEDQFLPLVFNLAMLEFKKIGVHAVVLRLNGLEAARSRFRLEMLPGAMQSPSG
ncbi:MAG TPA: hypothetical protein VNL71_18900 [Chloroflexota bacterium]|nr:hypothetical protein [Chloroflexota bacterium]